MPEPWYDEIFIGDGTLRPAFDALRDRTGCELLRPSVCAVEQLRDRPLDDDTRILPIPLVIDGDEYHRVVQAGVHQRASALQAFFADLVLGRDRAIRIGVGLTASVVDGILAAHRTSLEQLRELWRGTGEDAVRFVYGPDLVRGPDGRWVVIEDNVGCVGGIADGFFVPARYRAAVGLAGCPVCDRRPDLAAAIERFGGQRPDAALAAVPGCAGGGAVGDAAWELRLAEDTRCRTIVESLGIVVTSPDRLGDRPTAVVNFSSEDSAAWPELFAVPHVSLLNAPGTAVLGNKALLPYVENMIRAYLGQEPVLRTQPTRQLDAGTLPTDPDDWVIKSATGCQGNEVFILRGQTRERLASIKELVHTRWPGCAAVAQRYVEPSRLTAGPDSWDGYRLEIRPIGYALRWQEIFVGTQPVGKGVSVFDARRLNNISRGACYVPILREPCHAAG